MGNTVGESSKGLKKKSPKTVQKEIKKYAAENKPASSTIKLLLYGTGEAGKSTLLRQMQLINGETLIAERQRQKGLICLNVVEGAAYTVKAAEIKFGITFKNPEAEKAGEDVCRAYDEMMQEAHSVTLNLNDEDLVRKIQLLYEDPDFQKALRRKSEYQIHDGWVYYAECLRDYPNWGGVDWTPNANDLLHSRIRTVKGSRVDYNFAVNGVNYQMIDVGGQMSERKKFFQIFNEMNCVLYVASLSEYDQVLFEDDTVNRLQDTYMLWRSTVNADVFKNTWFILLFNKFDLFREKYYDEGIPIKLTFKYADKPPKRDAEINDGCEMAVEWYKKLLLSAVSESKQNQVRPYLTSALDSKSVDVVMKYSTSLLASHGELVHAM